MTGHHPPIRKTRIAVIGGAKCTPDEARIAYEVGREIAARGAVLICGGMFAVMEAACKGAIEAGGITVGILPGTSADDGNPYISIPLVTGMGDARNVIVATSGDAVIAVGGRYGTLSEIAFALKLHVPVVALASWDIASLDTEADITKAASAAEAVEKAFERIGR